MCSRVLKILLHGVMRVQWMFVLSEIVSTVKSCTVESACVGRSKYVTVLEPWTTELIPFVNRGGAIDRYQWHEVQMCGALLPFVAKHEQWNLGVLCICRYAQFPLPISIRGMDYRVVRVGK